METEIATLIQRLEAFHVALLDAALAASDLEELLTAAQPAAAAATQEPAVALPPTWKVDGTTVQTAPDEPWIDVYDAIKLALETCDQLEVPADAESDTTGRV